MSDSSRGRFVWYDLMTTDPEAAKAFYGAVAGWTTTPFEGGPGPYDMWVMGETPLGGLIQLPDEAKQAGAPTHWVGYVSVPDVDATLAQAQELGAAVIVPPQDIPTVGRFAMLSDPQGAAIAVFASETPYDGPGDMAEVGHYSWHELYTDDWEAGWGFYEALFGWKKFDTMDMGEAGIYQLFGNGEFPIGGMMNRPKEMPVSAWLYYVRVPSVPDAMETVTAGGGQVVHGPIEVPGGDVVAICVDPQGGNFALHHKAS